MATEAVNSELVEYLTSLLPSDTRSSLCHSVLPSLLHSIGAISQALRTSSNVSQVGTANDFGDDQLNVDVLAEDIIRSATSKCSAIRTASSEEDPIERAVHHEKESNNSNDTEQYTIAFDPLDGSSIIAPNWTVGTIIGIWDGPTALHQHPDKQIAAILGIYGPRTTAIIALRIPGTVETCFEVAIDSTQEPAHISVIKPNIQLSSPPFKTRYFSPANLRAASHSPNYAKLITHFISQKYTLRYSGGLVPDVVHALVKGHGVYVSPVTEQCPAKLRRLYELLPVALVVECAGGMAVDGRGERVLAREVKEPGEKGGLVCGTGDEVGAVLGFLREE